jgi:SNF2 family DNA or RNA helicase
MAELRSYHRLLITGTPLQNSMRELWAILHFTQPDVFQSWPVFEMQFGSLKDAEGYSRLHETIKPYMLRRVKKVCDGGARVREGRLTLLVSV